MLRRARAGACKETGLMVTEECVSKVPSCLSPTLRMPSVNIHPSDFTSVARDKALDSVSYSKVYVNDAWWPRSHVGTSNSMKNHG